MSTQEAEEAWPCN